jgi:hypothetical protein
MTDAPIVVIDLEASSFPRPGSYPIEVGVAFVATGASQAWLIRPPERWLEHGFWDPVAEELHGITLDMLLREGRSLEEVRAELTDAVAGHVVASDATTADGFWLWMLYHRTPPFALENVLELALRHGGLALRHSGKPPTDAWRAAVNNAYNLAHDRIPHEHRAEPDARRWAEVLRILMGLA